MYRQQFCADGGAADPCHARPALPRAPRSRLPGLAWAAWPDTLRQNCEEHDMTPTNRDAHRDEGRPVLRINDLEYLEMPGLNVMLAHDFYPEGHQGGVGVIQNGLRVATNGDLRLEPTPGQWQPVPRVGQRMVDRAKQEISVRMEYPDPEKDRKGFNPILYPNLHFSYVVKIEPI